MRISDWSSDVCSSDLLTGKGGKARFEIVNDGTQEHAFEIEGKVDGKEVEIATPHLKPGERATLIVARPRGEYQVYCPVDEHDDKGMLGTVTFAAKGGGWPIVQGSA